MKFIFALIALVLFASCASLPEVKPGKWNEQSQAQEMIGQLGGE
jgi:hypothetical protein